MAAVASSRRMLHIGVDEEIPPFHVKRFEYPEKRSILDLLDLALDMLNKLLCLR